MKIQYSRKCIPSEEPEPDGLCGTGRRAALKGICPDIDTRVLYSPPEDIAARIENSLRMRNRLYRPYCTPALSYIVVQAAVTSRQGRELSIKGLAFDTGLSIPTMCRKIATLRELGLLEVAPDPLDGRRSQIRLTVLSEQLAGQYLREISRIFYGE